MSNDAEINEVSDDDPLATLFTAVVKEAAEAIDALADRSEDDPDSFIQTARDLNPGALSRRATLALDDIERYVRMNINDLLSPEYELQDWTQVAYPHLPAGWLRTNTTHEIMDLERTIRDLRSAALSYGRFWQNNAGVGGVVKRAIGGYLNPLDGWMNLVGKSSSQTEQNFLISELADAFSELANAAETITEDIALKIRLKLSEISTSVP